MIVQKSIGNSIFRLSQSIVKEPSSFDWSRVKNLGFPILFDIESDKVLFDIAKIS